MDEDVDDEVVDTFSRMAGNLTSDFIFAEFVATTKGYFRGLPRPRTPLDELDILLSIFGFCLSSSSDSEVLSGEKILFFLTFVAEDVFLEIFADDFKPVALAIPSVIKTFELDLLFIAWSFCCCLITDGGSLAPDLKLQRS